MAEQIAGLSFSLTSPVCSLAPLGVGGDSHKPNLHRPRIDYRSVDGQVMTHSTIDVMTDDDADQPESPSAKVVTALLREARSLSRRADKLGSTVAAVDDPTTQHLVAEACTSIEQLVRHLILLERKVQRGDKPGGRQ